MSTTKFHAEDWINYYKAELDRDDVREFVEHEFKELCESIKFDGRTVAVRIDHNFETNIEYVVEDENGYSAERDLEVEGRYCYDVFIKISDGIEQYTEQIEEALNDAIEAGQATFELKIPARVIEPAELELYSVGIYGDRGLQIKTIDTDSLIDNEIKPIIAREKLKPVSEQIKQLRFICTIPAN